MNIKEKICFVCKNVINNPNYGINYRLINTNYDVWRYFIVCINCFDTLLKTYKIFPKWDNSIKIVLTVTSKSYLIDIHKKTNVDILEIRETEYLLPAFNYIEY